MPARVHATTRAPAKAVRHVQRQSYHVDQTTPGRQCSGRFQPIITIIREEGGKQLLVYNGASRRSGHRRQARRSVVVGSRRITAPGRRVGMVEEMVWHGGRGTAGAPGMRGASRSGGRVVRHRPTCHALRPFNPYATVRWKEENMRHTPRSVTVAIFDVHGVFIQEEGGKRRVVLAGGSMLGANVAPMFSCHLQRMDDIHLII